jgi:hypothetical protein
MRTPSLGAFFSKTNLLRWMLNLLLLPPAVASVTAYAQGGWQIGPNNSIAILSSGAGVDKLQVGLAKVNGEVDSSTPFHLSVRWTTALTQ